MPRSVSALWKTLGGLLSISLVLYGFAEMPGVRGFMLSAPGFHFYVISTVFVVAVAASVIVAWGGIRARDVNVMMVFVALLSLAGAFLIHGLATPGFLLTRAYRVPFVAAQLGLTLCALWMWLSAWPTDRPAIRRLTRRRRRFVPVAITIVGVADLLFLFDPPVSTAIPLSNRPVESAVAGLTMALYIWTAARHYRPFAAARLPVHAGVILGTSLLCLTQLVMMTSAMWTAAWWLYHVLLVTAMCVILYGIILQYRANTTLKQTFESSLFGSVMKRMGVGVSESVYDLILATERKDPYTAGHNLRVTLYALQLARSMGVAKDGLRALARGGVVHDVGKLHVPDEILNKPGPLTPEERSVIEQHPITGYELCRYIGFMPDELAVIRHHHERWDGTGYPDGLRGEEIPLLARILAVADVYDALTSSRAYRAAWPRERALEVIREGAGSQFDPACAHAWLVLCGEGSLAQGEAAATGPGGL
ncbi:HD-GYP domain-containing protein [Alicyclobacillus sp.]|uniref:HD-GYP domain-containing protein n=1 Tax=Alicyclobacillus sp. TaxID=61169 RepID=UPI0025C3B808|nr:HD-GYP domain-containing protein [Alicyclobacillus sp.]MCL6515319.1 HD-GYP domain-containing protein [Alicyclobacillus sp.]